MEDTDQTSDQDKTPRQIRMETIENEIDPDLTCEVPTGEDEVCGNEQDLENGIIVGHRPTSDLAECNLCIEGWFDGETDGDAHTFLSTRESQMIGYKSLGRTHSQIEELFKNRFPDQSTPTKETVSSFSRRCSDKYYRAVRTALGLGPIYDPDEREPEQKETEEELDREQVEA